MASVDISFDVEGVAGVTASLRKVQYELQDGTAAFEKMVPKLRGWLRKVFAGEGEPNRSGKWAPLSPAYARRKRKTHPGRKILVRTGIMRKSLVGKGDGAIVRISSEGMVFGTGVPYAQYHQRGTVKMPQRAIFDLTDEAWFTIAAKTMQGHLRSRCNRAGWPQKGGLVDAPSWPGA